MSNLGFWFMVVVFWFRDMVRPPQLVLAEIDIQPGSHVLDYGCGTGVFSFAAARIVGAGGKVWAVDVQPAAVRRVERIASKKGLSNVEAIRTDCGTALPDESIDVVLLYDVLHDLRDPEAVLAELHRLLKPGSSLSVSDHHMKEADILAGVTAGGGFVLVAKGKRTYTFRRAP